MEEKEKTIREFSEKLENLGRELSKIQYNFKIKNEPSGKYWARKIQEFETYHNKAKEYFFVVYSLINEIDEEQSGLFLLRLSKLRQLGIKLLENLKNVKENPAIMDLKDKQQSRWSIEQREKLFESNNDCLNHEKRMNVFFKEFYKKHLEENSK